MEPGTWLSGEFILARQVFPSVTAGTWQPTELTLTRPTDMFHSVERSF